MIMLGFAFTEQEVAASVHRYLNVQPHERTQYFQLLAHNFSKLLKVDVQYYWLDKHSGTEGKEVAFLLEVDASVFQCPLDQTINDYVPSLSLLKDLLLKHSFPVTLPTLVTNDCLIAPPYVKPTP